MPENFKRYFLRRLWWVLLTIIFILAAYFADMQTADSAIPALSSEIELRVIPLKKRDVSASTEYIGYVTPIHQVSLVSNVSGYISDVWVEGGQDVKIGDNLLMIDQREYKADYDAAIASRNQSRAEFNNAKIYFDRVKKVGSKAISQTEYDNAQAKFLAAQASLAAADADVQKAKVMLDYTLLQASIDGTVGNVALTPGNYVAPNSGALLSIVQYNPIRVVFSVSDKEYLNLQNSSSTLFDGQKIKIKLANGQIYKEDGVFKFTDNQINNSTNSIAVYADFKNPDKELVANAYVDVLLQKQFKDVFLIAQNHARLTPEGIFAHIIRNNKLIKTKLNVLATVDNNYVVGNRFQNNEYLVIDNVPSISEQTKVKIKVDDQPRQEQK